MVRHSAPIVSRRLHAGALAGMAVMSISVAFSFTWPPALGLAVLTGFTGLFCWVSYQRGVADVRCAAEHERTRHLTAAEVARRNADLIAQLEQWVEDREIDDEYEGVRREHAEAPTVHLRGDGPIRLVRKSSQT